MIGILLFSLFIIGIAILLSYLNHSKADTEITLVDEVNAILPQTQCGQCGYPGCKPYAEAIVNEEVPINQCPPGGQAGIKALATLLNVEEIPLNADNGTEKPPLVAIIDEDICIGCTLCIQACPVDAILGSAKHMHTVIEKECTGCELCVAPCPVDCIYMVDKSVHLNEWHFSVDTKIPLREPNKS